jgi:hypothetical protein
VFCWKWAAKGSIVHHPDDTQVNMEIDGTTLRAQNRRTQRKICLTATPSIANLTRSALGAKPVLRDKRPATNHLNMVKLQTL